MTMVEGPDSAVYIGSVAPYGQLESPLLKFSPETGSSQQFAVIHDQSITSLAVWHNLIIGGSTINGGPGSHATQTSACIFLWDPATRQKTFEMVPVPGKAMILDLIAAPNNHVYGVADDTLFEFNPTTKTIIGRQPLPFSKPIYDSVAVDGTGNIWGLAKEGIFTIDTKTSKVRLVAPSPVEITGGFAMRDGKIYFIAGSSVYSYTM
jgi:ligand-binding sensor domain-containing protein